MTKATIITSSPSDFNPSSYEGKPRWLPRGAKVLLRSFVDPLYARIAEMDQAERLDFIAACRLVSPINCGWDEYAIAKLLHGVAAFDEAAAAASRTAIGMRL